jgi:hypothetical protein
MEFFFKIAAELLSLFRISRENKSKEIELKNKEDFQDREKKQQEVSQKDKDEKLISEVISSTEEQRRQKLEEIRRVVSK